MRIKYHKVRSYYEWLYQLMSLSHWPLRSPNEPIWPRPHRPTVFSLLTVSVMVSNPDCKAWGSEFDSQSEQMLCDKYDYLLRSQLRPRLLSVIAVCTVCLPQKSKYLYANVIEIGAAWIWPWKRNRLIELLLNLKYYFELDGIYKYEYIYQWAGYLSKGSIKLGISMAAY